MQIPARQTSAPSTAQLSLSGLPDITLPHSPRTTALQEALHATEAIRAHEPEAGASPEAWRAWSDAGATAALEVDLIITSLGDSVEAHAARVLATLLREQLAYRARRSGRVFSAEPADRDRALEACVALGEVDARLSPWTQRCGALIAYWRADALWRRREVWPEECPEVHNNFVAVPDVLMTRPERPALALHIRSELSPRDEARVTAAVARALLARMPNAQVIPAREVRAAEQAFIAMRGFDGGECAAPPTTDERLAHAHPELLSLEIEALCHRHSGTRHCALRVQSNYFPGHAFRPLQVCVEGEPTVAAFEEAAAHLTTGLSVGEDSRCLQSLGHQLPPSLFGESASLESSEVNAALASIRAAVQACHDVDLAWAGIFNMRLDVARDGRVRRVDIEHVPGPRRIACLTRAFRSARFPAARMPFVVTGYGWFQHGTRPTVPMRARAEDQNRDGFGYQVNTRLQACVASNSPMHVIDGTLHIGANGIASRVDGDATDATSVCIRNALVGSIWSCGQEREVPLRLCIGNPEVPPEPVRP
jgi:hypothetical protein